MRARTYLPALFLAVGACAGDLPPGADTSALPTALAEVTQRLAAEINAERMARGHPRLPDSEKLARAAWIQADQMAKRDTLAHVLPGSPYPTLGARINAVGYPAVWAGETLAAGYSDPGKLVQAWLASGSHREVLLSRTPSEFGIALALTPGGRPYYSVVFGRP